MDEVMHIHPVHKLPAVHGTGGNELSGKSRVEFGMFVNSFAAHFLVYNSCKPLEGSKSTRQAEPFVVHVPVGKHQLPNAEPHGPCNWFRNEYLRCRDPMDGTKVNEPVFCFDSTFPPLTGDHFLYRQTGCCCVSVRNNAALAPVSIFVVYSLRRKVGGTCVWCRDELNELTFRAFLENISLWLRRCIFVILLIPSGTHLEWYEFNQEHDVTSERGPRAHL